MMGWNSGDSVGEVQSAWIGNVRRKMEKKVDTNDGFRLQEPGNVLPTYARSGSKPSPRVDNDEPDHLRTL